VQEAAIPLLSSWQSFYVIIGSSAGALTGLQFVVVTLIAGTSAHRSEEALGAFGTPTVVHFCVALLIAAILSAPWPTLWNVSLLLGLGGIAGVIYIIIVIQRTHRQNDYQPILEDWLWYVIFPLVSYAAFAVGAILLLLDAEPALFIIAAATLLLVFIGIHNAWDSVLYISVQHSKPEDKSQDE